MNNFKKEYQNTTPGKCAPPGPFINVNKRQFLGVTDMKSGIFYAKIGLVENSPLAMIHCLPLGIFKDWRYGKIEIDIKYLTNLIQNTNKWISRGGLLNLNFNHDPGQPAGRIQKLILKNNGLWVEAELLPITVEKLKSGEYSRFSPEWTDNFVDEKGEEYGLMLYAGAITNVPLFATTLDGIYLIEADGNLLKVAVREFKPTQEQKEKEKMDPEKLKKLTGSDDPEEQLKIIGQWKTDSEAKAEPENEEKEPANQEKVEEEEKKVANFIEQGKRIASLENELKIASQQVNELSKKIEKTEREKLLNEGYREGKITFAQKKAWKEIGDEPFPKNDSLKNYLASAAKSVPDEIGSELDSSNEESNEADKKSAKKLDMTDEQFKRYQKGEIKRNKKEVDKQ